MKAEEEERRARAAEERLEMEEQQRQAKRPRHDDLDLKILLEEGDAQEPSTLVTAFQEILQISYPRRYADPGDFTFDEEVKDEAAVEDLKEKLENLKVVARAKVCDNRIYSAAYHPEKSKDLIFFGGKTIFPIVHTRTEQYEL